MIKVTDHAVLRYLEREMDLDVERIRDTIAHSLGSHRAQQLVEFSSGVPCKIKVEGKTYCLRENTVTTFLGRKEKTGRPRQSATTADSRPRSARMSSVPKIVVAGLRA